MSMSNTSNKITMTVWIIGTFAILFSASAVISAALVQQRSVYAIGNNMTAGQISSGPNGTAPCKDKYSSSVLPLIKGYVKGHEVFYITTEASEKVCSRSFD